MTGLVTWCVERARMVLAFVVISVAAGFISYVSLPKEGAPNIDIPVLYVSVPLPGISALDAERLIVKPLELEMRGVEGLKEMTGTAMEGHASILLEFDFGWDKAAILADVRDKLDRAKAEFPSDAEEPRVFEVNLSQFPIITVSISGDAPERTMVKLAKDLQREIEAVASVLEVSLQGHRDEMIEVEIDPLRLESYNVTTSDLLNVVDRNNLLVAAGAVESGSASFSVSVPGSFETISDVVNLPVKVSGDRVVRLKDVADIRRTFEDAEGRARYNGTKSISLQASKRIGENIIETVNAVREVVERETAKWPAPLASAVSVAIAMDESAEVKDMVSQLESSVMTAVILVMLVVLASLGFRSALLVGIAVPCSFLLSFGLMGALGMSINNMTMFGLILAVGMLVDGAIVVVEYADKRIQQGDGPMRAYAGAAKRMFWPITASTATTLCAFLPMIFWPGMPGEFMGQLPITLIFVLTASLIVALIYLPVLGGLAGRVSRAWDVFARQWREFPLEIRLATLSAVLIVSVLISTLILLSGLPVWLALLPALVLIAAVRLSFGRASKPAREDRYHRTAFGRLVALIVANPIGPIVALAVAIGGVIAVFGYYGENNNGTEFFVDTDPTRAIVYVRSRGNTSLENNDRLVRMVENRVLSVPGISSVFAFSGDGGLTNASEDGPRDTIGQIQFELVNWRERGSGKDIIQTVRDRIADLPGIQTEVFLQQDGPQQGKPVQLELRSNTWTDLLEAAAIARARFEATDGLVDIDDTRPLPGIEWRITVDRTTAGRYGADVASVGPMVQFVTRGATLDTYRPDDLDEEIDIRARFPEEDRVLSTLDELRIPTNRGLVPLSNFIDRKAVPKLAEISRRDTERYILVRADVGSGASENEKIQDLQAWLETDPFPASVSPRFVGDWEEQQESQAFLLQAFGGALGLMFVILLAQFNSVYNAVLVLTAVVMSVAGVLIGMLVMGQKFSIIMTGTGIVALAGIVVNNNIVLIDTFQEFARRMDRLEAIIRTAEARIRPVLLTTITTMAGLTPMMFAMSLDFTSGQVSFGAPTALWWTQLATAVVWGLGTATILTLLVTPAALAIREWIARGAYRGLRITAATLSGDTTHWQDRRLARALRKAKPGDTLIWEDPTPPSPTILRAAE